MEENGKIYIERQKNYTKQRGTFGPLGSISANGCGAIAIYNVLIHFGMKIDFMTIVNRFNRQWLMSTSIGGMMGSYIFYLHYLLKQYRFQVHPIFFVGKNRKDLHLDEKSAIIFLYFWKKKKKLGAHYQAGFGNADGTITLHNPNATYFGIQDLLNEKCKKETMWLCMALMIRKS